MDFSYAALQEKFGNGIPCPDDFSFPSHVLDVWSSKQPELPALHWVSSDFAREKVVTYSQLSDLSHRAAFAFAEAGLKKGDRVMVQLPRVNEYVERVLDSGDLDWVLTLEQVVGGHVRSHAARSDSRARHFASRCQR